MRLTRRIVLGVALLATALTTLSLHTLADKAPGHRTVIHVGTNDPEAMNNALNYATNVTKFYADKGEQVSVEILANGPGLHMLRADTSPVKGRLLVFASRMPQVAFSGCGVAKRTMESQEGKEVTLVSAAKVVPSGAVRLIELQEQGWSYLRP